MGIMTQAFDFQSIFDLQPSPAVLLNNEGYITHANQALLRELGSELFDTKGKYFPSILKEPFTRESFSFFKSRFNKEGIYEPLPLKLKGTSQVSWEMNLLLLPCGETYLVSFLPPASNVAPASIPSHQEEHFPSDFELQKLKQEMDHLLYVLGHDLRAPMRAILGFSQILKDSHKEFFDEEGIELLSIIQDNTRKLNSLVSNLVEFSRLSPSVTRSIPIDLKELVGFEYNKLLTTCDTPREIDFEMGELKVISSDPVLIKVIVIELLSNAIKFTRNASAAHIKVGGYVDAKGYTFYVKDNGKGFNMKNSEKVFGIFEKLVLEEEYEGNGIGLARVNKAVQMLRGRIWPESELGEGSTFFVFIPQKGKD